MERIVYADHSATTFVKDEVLREMLPYFTRNFGNASSGYSIGRNARLAIDNARCKVATAIGARSDEIYFTSGGSEADNMIIKGIARKYQNKGKHIITSSIEHMAVLNSCHFLEKEGFEVTYLPVDKNGRISLRQLEESIREDTILISIMYVNNEIGTIEPIQEIGRIAKAHQVFFHTDAVQAVGNLNIDVRSLNVDALSMSAHKFYGPKGVGVAYIKKGILFDNLIDGGHQEFSKRAGTENVAGIVGLGEAISLAYQNLEEEENKIRLMRNYLYEGLMKISPDITLNGSMENRIAGNLNVSFPKILNENMLLLLNMNQICVSTGSACNSQAVEPSHVLKAIGCQNPDKAIRFSIGRNNTMREMDQVLKVIKNIICK